MRYRHRIPPFESSVSQSDQFRERYFSDWIVNERSIEGQTPARISPVNHETCTSCGRLQPAASYTPTGNGLVCVVVRPAEGPKRPWSSDISPVYQYPSTNNNKNGTVM